MSDWWKSFRQFEYEALQEVLASWFQIISLWWWTMYFDRNRDSLSRFDTLKIFLQVDVKTQLERLVDPNATWNGNRASQTNWKTKEEELQKLYNLRNELYEDNAHLSFDTLKWTKESLLNEVIDKINLKTKF